MLRPHAARLALPVLFAMTAACAAAPLTAPLTQHQGLPGVQLAQSSVEIIAPSAPPVLREEPIPPPPSREVIWQPGYWSWGAGNQWVWVAGRYMERPSPVASWEPGHWVQQPNGWLWVAGRWRTSAG